MSGRLTQILMAAAAALLLASGCEENFVRNNPYDPQSGNTIIGTLSGSVSPANSGASVHARKGLVIQQSSPVNSDGSFSLEGLPEGLYTLIVEAPNFVTDSSLNDLQVTARQNFSVGTIYLNSALYGTIFGQVEPYNPAALVILLQNGVALDSTGLNAGSQFSFPLLNPGQYALRIELGGYAPYTRDPIIVTAGISTNIGMVVLNDLSRGSITGYITPKSSGAVVTLHQDTQTLDSTAIAPLTGQYVFSNLEPGYYWLTVAADGYATNLLDSISVVGGQTSEGHNSILEKTGEISGTVYPVNCGAWVKVFQGQEAVDSTTINSINGGYDVAGLDPGYYSLEITAAGWIPNTDLSMVVVNAGGITSLPRVYLAQEGSNTVYGRVANQLNDNPIAGAMLSLETQTAYSDVEGYFAFYGLPSGYRTILVQKNGFLTTYSAVSVPVTGSASVNVTMSPCGALAGYVTTSQGGGALDSARISVDYDNFVTYTDPTGYYSLAQLSSGPHLVSVTKNGYNPHNENVTTAVGQTITLNVILTPLSATCGTLFGHVKNQFTNMSLVDAIVQVAGQGGMTNNYGDYIIYNVPAGNHQVSVSYPEYIPQSVPVTINAGQTTTRNFSMLPIDSAGTLPTGTVSGYIHDFYTNQIINYSGYAYINLYYINSTSTSFYANSITGGYFQIMNHLNYPTTPNIPVGSYRFSTYALYEVGPFGYIISDSVYQVNSGSNNWNIRAKEMCSIGGIVTDVLTGNPVPQITVYVATSQSDGTYYCNHMNSDMGSISVWDNQSNYYNETVAVSLISGQHNVINIAVTPYPKLIGTVTDAVTGQGLSNVEISTSNAATAFSGTAGSYQLKITQEGDHIVNFAKPGYHNFSTFVNVPHTGSLTLNVALIPN